MTNSIIQYLNSINHLSKELIEYLNINLKVKHFKKNEIILREGNVCKNIFFIEQGLVRSFYTKEIKEVTSWFMKEGDIIISVESFFTQTPSYENIQAIENCITQYINFEQLQHIYCKFAEFNLVGRVLTERY